MAQQNPAWGEERCLAISPPVAPPNRFIWNVFSLLASQIDVEPWSGTFRFRYEPFMRAFEQSGYKGDMWFDQLERLRILEDEFKQIVSEKRKRDEKKQPDAGLDGGNVSG